VGSPQSPSSRHQLSPQCTDFSSEGSTREEAAECAVHAARLIARAKLKCYILENVPGILSSNAWRRAQGVLTAVKYLRYVFKLRACNLEVMQAYKSVHSASRSCFERGAAMVRSHNERQAAFQQAYICAFSPNVPLAFVLSLSLR
jgi:C-5 cytosine-specific DNA methylase